MENIEKILSLIFVSIGIIAYIVTTILAIKRKKAAGEDVNVIEALASVAKNVLGLVQSVEIGALPKTGDKKLEIVLNATKQFCQSAQIDYDEDYWTKYINKAVELININRKAQSDNENIIAKQ